MNYTIHPNTAVVSSAEPTFEVLAREMSLYFGENEDEHHMGWLRAAINSPHWNSNNLDDIPAVELRDRIVSFVEKERANKQK